MRAEVAPGDGSSLASVVAYDATSGAQLWSDVSPAKVSYNAAVRTGSWGWALGVSPDGATNENPFNFGLLGYDPRPGGAGISGVDIP